MLLPIWRWKLPASFDDEYVRRAEENIAACERILRFPLTDDQQQAVGIMVWRQMKREATHASQQ